MNYFVSKKIENFETTTNKVEKIIKIRYSIEFIIILNAVRFFSFTRAKKLTSKKLINTLLLEFQKKNPLLTSWIKLLRYSLDLLNIETKNFDPKIGQDIQEISNLFLPKKSKKEIEKDPDLSTVIKAFTTIRNKGIAHTTAIEENDAEKILSYDFEAFPYYLCEYLDNLFPGKLLLASDINKIEEDGQEHLFNFLDYSVEIPKNFNFSYSDIMYELDYIFHQNLYFYFPDEKVKFVHAAPFIIYYEKGFYHFNEYVDNIPTFLNFKDGKRISINKLKNSITNLIEEDKDFLSPEISYKLKKDNNVYHNLIKPTFKRFIGRSQSLEKLFKALNHKRLFLITISGIGGVGKSALAIKAVYDLIKSKEKSFSFIIWVSAKRSKLTPEGIIQENQIFESLNQLLDLILKITGFAEGINYDLSEKKEYCTEILGLDKFLLIIDNFETLPENKIPEFLEFFEIIGDKCLESKILITTRHQLGESEKIIDLKELSLHEYKEFVEYLYHEKFSCNGTINNQDIEKLYEYTGGLPLATEFFIGQLEKNNSFNSIIEKIENNQIQKGEILKFSFEESFQQLNEPDKKIMFSIALLDNADIDKISFLTNIEELDVEDIIDKLKGLSFINEKTTNEGIEYTALPLTEKFLLEKLDEEKSLKDNLELKLEEINYIFSANLNIKEEDTSILLKRRKKNLAYMLAKAAYESTKTGNLNKAEEYFQKAEEYDPNEGAIWYYKAIVNRDFAYNIDSNSFEKAIKNAKNENERDNIRFEYGKSLMEAEKFDASINVLNKIPSNFSNINNVYHFIGKAKFFLGKKAYQSNSKRDMKKYNKEAMEFFHKSLFQSPKTYHEKNHNTIGYYFMALISKFSNDIDDAMDFIDKGLDLQPNNYKLDNLREELIYSSSSKKSKKWF